MTTNAVLVIFSVTKIRTRRTLYVYRIIWEIGPIYHPAPRPHIQPGHVFSPSIPIVHLLSRYILRALPGNQIFEL